MNFSAWSIRNPIPIIVLFLVLTLSGAVAFQRLGIDERPNIDLPVVRITVSQPGASPTELESDVTKPIEDGVAGLGNIDTLVSKVSDGVSRTTVTFVLRTDTDRATNDVGNAVSQVRQGLPQEVEEPVVQRLEFAGGPIMTYGVGSPQRSVAELSYLVDEDISRALLNVPGVAQVQRLGGVDREIRVDLNPARLEALGITATQVNDQLRAFNTNLPGGRTTILGTEKNIRTLGRVPSVEDLRQHRITLPGGGTVPLTDLATVIDGYQETRQLTHLTQAGNSVSQPVVGFQILRSTGSTLVTVEESVRQAIADLQLTLPPDLDLDLIFTKADFIRASYRSSINALLLGCLLTVVTVGFFLRDWRPTLMTALALPLSITPSFLVMSRLGYTLNSMTLLALSLSIGNLVDDAICMTENIDQHLQMGKSPFRAAMDAAQEIGLAVIATTATIVAVFLPVAFMGGIPGQFFQPFGVTVAVTTSFSTLVAVTLTPLVGAYILKPKALGQAPPSQRSGLYRRTLVWALKHRVTTVLLAVALFIGSLQLVSFIPKGLFGSPDTGLSTVNIDLPPGHTLEETDQVAQRATTLLLENDAVDRVLATVGNLGTNGQVNTATLYTRLRPEKERSLSQAEFEQQLREPLQQIPGARISFQSGEAGGSDTDLSLLLKGKDPTVLNQAVIALEQEMRQVPGLVEVSSTASLVKPEILIQPKPLRATDLGVSVQAIARTARLATLGDAEANLPKFDLPDRQIPIRVQLAPTYRDDLNTLRNLRVPSNSGRLVPLDSVAEITLGSGPAEIDRFDRSRQVAIGANIEGVSLGQALQAVYKLPAFKNLPPDVSSQPTGDAEIMQDIFSRFLEALLLAILAIYAVLVLLYNNFLHPLTILVALPLSFAGTFLALLLTQKELGLYALIGIVLLMGLVTKNAILLVDCALANQQSGKRQFSAVVEAGVSRFRPIIMTAISTVSGMIPIALELGGADAETRSPMGIAVIGGFTTATALTLVVVPVIFTYMDNLQRWLFQPLRQQAERKSNPPETWSLAPQNSQRL